MFLACHLRSHQERCPMSAVCCEGGVGGRSRAGLRLSLNRSISEPGPAIPPMTVTTPTNSKRFRFEPLPSLPASLPASPSSDGTNLNSALVLKKVRTLYILYYNHRMCCVQLNNSRFIVLSIKYIHIIL